MANSKNIKGSFQKYFMILSHVFIPILFNIGSYIYIIRYKPDTKYMFFKNIFFRAYDQILKVFQAYCHNCFLQPSHVLKYNMDIVSNL